jgi:hypothetical protein
VGPPLGVAEGEKEAGEDESLAEVVVMVSEVVESDGDTPGVIESEVDEAPGDGDGGGAETC